MLVGRILKYILQIAAGILFLYFFTLLFMKLYIYLMTKFGSMLYEKENNIRFDEDFIIETTAETTAKRRYHKISKISAGKDAVYVYTSGMRAIIIPLQAFESAEQKDSFLAFICDKTGHQINGK